MPREILLLQQERSPVGDRSDPGDADLHRLLREDRFGPKQTRRGKGCRQQFQNRMTGPPTGVHAPQTLSIGDRNFTSTRRQRRETSAFLHSLVSDACCPARPVRTRPCPIRHPLTQQRLILPAKAADKPRFLGQAQLGRPAPSSAVLPVQAAAPTRSVETRRGSPVVPAGSVGLPEPQPVERPGCAARVRAVAGRPANGTAKLRFRHCTEIRAARGRRRRRWP